MTKSRTATTRAPLELHLLRKHPSPLPPPPRPMLRLPPMPNLKRQLPMLLRSKIRLQLRRSPPSHTQWA